MNLKDLINNCAKGNRKAQNELYLKYKDTLYFLSLKYCRNEAEAEDNLHDTFIAIFQQIKTYKNKGSFEGWMKRITIYKAIDKYKDKRPIGVDLKDDILEDTHVEDELLNLPLETFLTAIQELPDQYRLVFNLYQMDGFSHKEVAKLLEISESTSKSNFHRAKILLREKLTGLVTAARR